MDHEWDIRRLFHHGLQDRGNSFSFHFIVRKFFTAYSQTGFTVILIERGPGVSTKPIKTAYSSVAGTAYVIFDKVSYSIGASLLFNRAHLRFVCPFPIPWEISGLECLLFFPISIMNDGW